MGRVSGDLSPFTTMQVEHRYHSVRVIAVHNTSDLPMVPGM